MVQPYHALSRPRLSSHFIALFPDADAAAPLMSYIDYQRAPEADFYQGGAQRSVFAHYCRLSTPSSRSN